MEDTEIYEQGLWFLSGRDFQYGTAGVVNATLYVQALFNPNSHPEVSLFPFQRPGDGDLEGFDP